VRKFDGGSGVCTVDEQPLVEAAPLLGLVVDGSVLSVCEFDIELVAERADCTAV
jgi:hypothetical protein